MALYILSTSLNAASVGQVLQQSQSAQIVRDSKKILTEVATSVKMHDDIETLNGVINLKFIDDTKVSLSEYSKLTIDEYVYDPVSREGKLSIKGKLGTLRYSSGLIAKKNRKNVKITSPTASVAVRGTDFTMSVDAAGITTFKLLPSIDATGNVFVGSIEVSNAGGTVLLNRAYQITKVTNLIDPPTKPTQGVNINNLIQEEQRNDNLDSENSNKEDSKVIDNSDKKVTQTFLKTQDNKALLLRTTNQGGVLSLKLDPTSNATVNHTIGGELGVFQLNSGNAVIFNIEQ